MMTKFVLIFILWSLIPSHHLQHVVYSRNESKSWIKPHFICFIHRVCTVTYYTMHPSAKSLHLTPIWSKEALCYLSLLTFLCEQTQDNVSLMDRYNVGL